MLFAKELDMHVLITGAAGFIGHPLALYLLKMGHSVVGIDNLNAYYDVQLKKDRLSQLEDYDNFKFIFADLTDGVNIAKLFEIEKFSHVVNLAAQAGVRYSITNPSAYIQSNLVGFGNILEGCRNTKVEHLIFASSSSVYGLNTAQPFSVHHNVDHPVSLYAASKKANELMAHSYSHLYKLPCTGLRFFTVYGPWNRPDMALHLFATAIINNKPIQVFNKGQMQRDFTYIDDIVQGLVKIIDIPASPNENWDANQPDPASSSAPWRIYNIGNNNTVRLGEFIETLENALGKKAIKEYLPMQDGDVKSTYANIDDLTKLTGFAPSTSLEYGIKMFVDWYRQYYSISI